MIFSKIKGHNSALSQISKEIQKQSFEGVFLFTGPMAVGKFTIAKAIGKYLTCTGLEDDTCRCENCRHFPNVPDYLEICKNGGMITVGDVEPITSFLTLVAYRGKSRVIIIDDAHNMNKASANRLLKILEDIPKKCVVILISDSPDKLLPPMLSRCYQLNFSSLPVDDIRDLLKILGNDTRGIAEISRMIPYLSESVLVNYHRYTQQLLYVPKFLANINTMGEDDLITEIKEIDRSGNINIFIDILLIFVNDLLKIRYDSPDIVSSLKNIDRIEELTAIWKDDLCVYTLDRIRTFRAEMRKKINLNPGQLFLPTVLWIYYFLHKNKK